MTFSFRQMDALLVRYILRLVKQIRTKECQTLRGMITDYTRYMTENSNSTILAPFLALIGIRVKAENPWYYLVMKYAYPAAFSDNLDYLFDLKGSRFHRIVDEKTSKGKALKDQNWLDKGIKIDVNAVAAEKLKGAIARDTAFLEAHNLFDYSFLLAYKKNAYSTRSNSIIHSNGNDAYFVAIIDYLTVFDFVRELELETKAFIYPEDSERGEVSILPPKDYAERFRNFLGDQIRVPAVSFKAAAHWFQF